METTEACSLCTLCKAFCNVANCEAIVTDGPGSLNPKKSELTSGSSVPGGRGGVGSPHCCPVYLISVKSLSRDRGFNLAALGGPVGIMDTAVFRVENVSWSVVQLSTIAA